MRPRRTTRVTTNKIIISGFLALFLSSNAPADSDVIKNMALPLEARKFEAAFPGDDKISFATVYGDRRSGQHGTFGRFPPNFETPPHVHSHGYRAVVLSGVMTNPFKGEKDPPALNPGSFWSVEAGSEHATACISDTPCEFFMYSAHSFDFKPTGQ